VQSLGNPSTSSAQAAKTKAPIHRGVTPTFRAMTLRSIKEHKVEEQSHVATQGWGQELILMCRAQSTVAERVDLQDAAQWVGVEDFPDNLRMALLHKMPLETDFFRAETPRFRFRATSLPVEWQSARSWSYAGTG